MIASIALPPARLLPAKKTFPSYSRAALAVAGVLMLLRLLYIGGPDLFPEEAYYWNYAKHLDLAYLDHPPLVGWLIHFSCSLFGDGEFGVRIFATLCSVVTTFFVYRLTELLYGRRAGVMAVLLVQVLPFFFMAGLMMTPDAPLAACWAGVLYFFARAVFGVSVRAWWGVGICLGLGLLSKYTIVLLGPAILLFLALDPASRGWFRRVAPYGALLLAALFFSPVVVWNAQHHWASFSFQTLGRIAPAARFSLHQLAGSALLLLTPLGGIATGKCLWGRGTPAEFSERPHLDPARLLLFARLFTLLPLSVFVLFSLRHPVKLNWTGPLWLGVVPMLALHLSSLERRPGSFLRRAWVATVAVFALSYLAMLHYLAIGIPGFGYASKTEWLPVGWSEMGRALSLQKDALRRAFPGKTLVVGLDRNFIASEAAFYQSHRIEAVRETTGVHLFGGVSLMYKPWFAARDQESATLLLVSFNEIALTEGQISAHCERLGPIEEHWLKRRGFDIRPYYTRVAYCYRSAGL